MTIEPGRSLLHYELVEKLGEGGMGVVWKAVDRTLHREVAIKFLPESLAADAERLTRFEHEARALAALNHPNIATIHGLEQAEGVRFLVMELVAGEELAERIARGALPVETALAIGVQLAEALEAAHEQGIIHRDLKPANIKISDEDKVKVLDFGLSKALDPGGFGAASGDPSLSPTVTSAGTAAGVILGTAAYMSPEQAKGKPVDRRADVWAFGVVMYEMLTGRPLFKGESISETLASVLMGEPDAGALPPNTPPRVRRLLERCLRKDPQARLRDAGDARLVIEEALAGREWTATGTVEAETARRTRPWTIALVAVAALVVGGLGGRLSVPTSTAGSSAIRSLSVLTSLEDPEVFFAPDGKSLVFRTEQGMVVRRLESFQETLLPGTENGEDPALSPDGRWAAFHRRKKLFKVPIDGSAPPVQLGEYPREPNFSQVWLPGGTIVGISREPFTLMKIPADGGAVQAVPIEGDGVGQNVFWPVNPLPDGRHMLAAADTFSDDVWRVNVVLVDTETGAARILVEDAGQASLSPTGHLLFSRKEALLAVPFDSKRFEVTGGAVGLLDGLWVPNPISSAWFGLSDDGTLVYRTDVNDFTRLLAVVDDEGNVSTWSDKRRDYSRRLAVSGDGRMLAAHVTNWDQGLEEIWVSAMDRPRLSPLVDEPGIDCGTPVLSFDGTLLYYSCNGKGNAGGIYRRHTDGSDDPELLFARESADASLHVHGLTPDGEWLLIRRFGEDTAVMLLPVGPGVSGEREPKLLVEARLGSFANGPVLSPDGEWLAYHDNETGRTEVYVQPLRPDGRLGQKVLVTSDGGASPRWGWTGPGKPLTLYYGHGPAMWAVDITAGAPLRISEPREVLDGAALRARLTTPLPGGGFLFAQADEAELEEAVRVRVVLGFGEELERLGGRR